MIHVFIVDMPLHCTYPCLLHLLDLMALNYMDLCT
jgi:hypothetical protein